MTEKNTKRRVRGLPLPPWNISVGEQDGGRLVILGIGCAKRVLALPLRMVIWIISYIADLPLWKCRVLEWWTTGTWWFLRLACRKGAFHLVRKVVTRKSLRITRMKSVSLNPIGTPWQRKSPLAPCSKNALSKPLLRGENWTWFFVFGNFAFLGGYELCTWTSNLLLSDTKNKSRLVRIVSTC